MIERSKSTSKTLDNKEKSARTTEMDECGIQDSIADALDNSLQGNTRSNSVVMR